MVVKMREMRLRCFGHTRRDKIRNEDIWDKVGMALVVVKQEMKLRCFGHTKR